MDEDTAATIAATFTTEQGCSTVVQSSIDPTIYGWKSNGPPCPANGTGAVYAGGPGTFFFLIRNFDTTLPYCVTHSIDEAVGLELGICQAISPLLYSVEGAHPFTARPTTIITGAHSVIVRLKWSGWGSPKATARGTLRYADSVEGFSAPVEVSLSQRDVCEPHRVYLRRTVRFTRAADRRAHRLLAGVSKLTCPEA